MAETDRFQGMLETHIHLLKSLQRITETELEHVPQEDAFLRGLKRGTADTFQQCVGWLTETLEKEKSKNGK